MKEIIASIIFVLFSFSLLVGLGNFFVGKIYEKRDHLVGIQREIQRTEARQQNVKDLEKLFGEVQEREDEIKNVFVSERSVVAVIEAFEASARDVGVQLEVESAALPTGSAVRGPEIQLHLEGNFDGLYRYVKVLEVLPFQFSVDFLNISKRKSVEGSAEWTATIRLTVLSFLSQ